MVPAAGANAVARAEWRSVAAALMISRLILLSRTRVGFAAIAAKMPARRSSAHRLSSRKACCVKLAQSARSGASYWADARVSSKGPLRCVFGLLGRDFGSYSPPHSLFELGNDLLVGRAEGGCRRGCW